MASMNVSVPDLMRDWIQSRIESGKYATVSDYVRDLVRKDQAATADQERWLASLDTSIERALSDAAEGRVMEAEAVFDRLHAKYAAMAGTREKR